MKEFPAFLALEGSQSAFTIHSYISVLPDHLTHRRTVSNMNTLPIGNRESSLSGDPYHYGMSHTHTDNITTNNVRGNSNTNFTNVSNSYNINVRVSEESSLILAWFSPLEHHARDQDVRNRRLDGVGDWVLRKNEFESWRESQDASINPTLLCYGDQGVGKTYIRYGGIFPGR